MCHSLTKNTDSFTQISMNVRRMWMTVMGTMVVVQTSLVATHAPVMKDLLVMALRVQVNVCYVTDLLKYKQCCC